MKPFSKRYFSDFETREVLDQRGKRKQELIYVGNTFTALLSESAHQKRKWLKLCLTAVCVAAFLTANTRNVSSNRAGVLAAIGILVVLPLFLVCYAAVCGVGKGRQLRRTEYIEVSMLLKFGGFFSGALGLALAGWHTGYACTSAAQGELAGEALVCAAWGVFAACCIFLWVSELRVEYREKNREGSIIHREHFKRKG